MELVQSVLSGDCNRDCKDYNKYTSKIYIYIHEAPGLKMREFETEEAPKTEFFSEAALKHWSCLSFSV